VIVWRCCEDGLVLHSKTTSPFKENEFEGMFARGSWSPDGSSLACPGLSHWMNGFH